MFGRKKQAPTFRQCVDSRYQYDLVMNGLATILVLLVPLSALLITFLLSQTDSKYSVLTDYWPKIVMICCSVEIYVFMIVAYRLFSRLISHAKRDSIGAEALIAYSKSKGCDTKKLRVALDEMESKQPFLARHLALLLLVAMFAYMIWVLLFAVPVIEDLSGGNEDVVLGIGGLVLMEADVVQVAYAVGITLAVLLVLVILVLVILVPIFKFPNAHENAQVLFTKHLVNTLDKVGISILPMAVVTKRMHFSLNFILMMMTGFLWTPFMLFKIFRNMNNHLMNEWVYEAELLKAVESDGKEGFDSEFFSFSPAKLRDGRAHARKNRRFSKMMRRISRSENKLPRILIIAELFLIVLCANYILKIIALTATISDNPADYTFTLFTILDLPFSSMVTIALVVMDLYFTMLMIDAILGLASRRATSWRKVVRSCVTFVIPLWISALITKPTGISHIFDFNVYLTTAVLGAVMLMMILSDTIRRYYTPVGYETPGMPT